VSSSYPNAFCVKCGSHTDTLQKHTVLLQNNARALRGVCASCSSEVYKILPKGVKFKAVEETTAEEKKQYPDAFCVKCKEKTPTNHKHTVILENNSRAVTGSCQACGSDVYRILGKKDGKPALSLVPAKLSDEPRAAARSERRDDAKAKTDALTYVMATAVVLGIISAFLAYTIF
jgi:hypothetical protein